MKAPLSDQDARHAVALFCAGYRLTWIAKGMRVSSPEVRAAIVREAEKMGLSFARMLALSSVRIWLQAKRREAERNFPWKDAQKSIDPMSDPMF